MKASAVIRIVIWVIVAMLLLAILIAGITGGLGRWFQLGDWTNDVFNNGSGGNYGSYEYEDRYTIASSGSVDGKGINAVYIDWLAGNVDVVEYDGDTIEFEEYSSTTLDPDYQMRYYVNGNTLNIRYARSRTVFSGLFRNLNKTLTVRIPRNMNIDKFSVDTTSADIKIVGIDARDMEADTTSGRVDISDGKMYEVDADTTSGAVSLTDLVVSDKVDVDTVSGKVTFSDLTVSNSVGVDTTSGAVEMSRVEAYDVDCDTVSGKVELSDCTIRKFEADTTSGTVDLDSRTMPDDVKISTVSGSMTVRIPENNGFRATWDKVSGSFNCDFAVSQTKDTATYKDGGATIRFDTISGSMNIRQR